MQKKKRNHWVPQGYLRAFAADGETRRKIWRFGHKNGDPELKPIEKVAVKFHLYTPQGPNGRDYSIEDKLASLENSFGEEAWRIISTGFIDLCDETFRKHIALLTAVMHLRNPSQLEMTHSMHRSFVDWFSTFPDMPNEIEVEIAGRVRTLNTTDWPQYRDADEHAVKRMWLDQVGSAVWLAKIMMKMRWAVMIADVPTFITSDNPVVAMHSIGDRFRGFKDPDTTIVFPLSPTRVLFMDNRHNEPDGQYYPLKDSGGTLNGLVWRYALEHMFSSRHPDEVCADIIGEAENMGLAC